MATVICDGCGGKTDSYVYCDSCFDGLKSEIEELNSENGRLEREVEELEGKIKDLEIENKTLNEGRE